MLDLLCGVDIHLNNRYNLPVFEFDVIIWRYSNEAENLLDIRDGYNGIFAIIMYCNLV